MYWRWIHSYAGMEPKRKSQMWLFIKEHGISAKFPVSFQESNSLRPLVWPLSSFPAPSSSEPRHLPLTLGMLLCSSLLQESFPLGYALGSLLRTSALTFSAGPGFIICHVAISSSSPQYTMPLLGAPDFTIEYS